LSELKYYGAVKSNFKLSIFSRNYGLKKSKHHCTAYMAA